MNSSKVCYFVSSILLSAIFQLNLLAQVSTTATNQEILMKVERIIPLPRPTMTIVGKNASEMPIAVTNSESVVCENGFYKRVRTSFTFTNPNPRTMEGALEFPIPEEAFVCGYSLEVEGEMIPGVVCEQEKARVAFENETRKGVDPGIVEKVKGSIWRTRIFPLEHNIPRRAEVDYIVPIEKPAQTSLYEQDGEDVFFAMVATTNDFVITTDYSYFSKGQIVWDASASAGGHASEWRKKIETLPETGTWSLIVFRNAVEEARSFTKREQLLEAIDQLVYDGGTDLSLAVKSIKEATLLFTDETDTLGLLTDGAILQSYETNSNKIGRAHV